MNASAAQHLARNVCLSTLIGLGGIYTWYATRLDYAFAYELWWLRVTGYTALGALFLSLLMTPVALLCTRLLPQCHNPVVWIAFRRSLGMSAAWLGGMHACVALATYLEGSWPLVVAAPYLRAGLTALMILLALLITSFPALVRILHLRFWKQLHRLAYVAGVAGILHYLWLTKADLLEPLLYAAVLAALLGVRVWFRFAGRRSPVARSLV